MEACAACGIDIKKVQYLYLFFSTEVAEVSGRQKVRDPLRGKCFFFGPKTTADEYGERKVNTVVVLHNLPSAKDSTEKSETKDFICSVVSDNPAQWYDDHLFSDPRRHVG